MRKSDELRFPHSCLNRAKNDEWLFVLLGRDVAAPAAIQAWIEERIRLGKNRPGEDQILQAKAVMKQMESERRQEEAERTAPSQPATTAPPPDPPVLPQVYLRETIVGGITRDTFMECLRLVAPAKPLCLLMNYFTALEFGKFQSALGLGRLSTQQRLKTEIEGITTFITDTRVEGGELPNDQIRIFTSDGKVAVFDFT